MVWVVEEKILTLHPQGKKGVNMSKAKYDAVRAAMLSALKTRKVLTHDELVEAIQERLEGKFDGRIAWYAEYVKRDLEARKVIDRTAAGELELYRLIAKNRAVPGV